VTAGAFSRANQETLVTSESFVTSAREVEDLVVSVHDRRPVYLRDIATVLDGPEEAVHYARIGFPDGAAYPAVTLALAKKKGTNAVDVAAEILRRLEDLKENVIPDGVEVEVTRNYGQTAQDKVNDLLVLLLLPSSPWWPSFFLPWVGGKPWWWPCRCPSHSPWLFLSISFSDTPSTV
jgi:multidrug efflux pump subunit AcrB